MAHDFGRGERWTVGLTVIAAICLSVAGGAIAAKSGNGGWGGATSSIELVLIDQADGTANVGDRVTFDVWTTATDRPFVRVDCYQGPERVYSASVGFFDGSPWVPEFTLAADSWPAGAADCTATLYANLEGERTTKLATLSFAVGP